MTKNQIALRLPFDDDSLASETDGERGDLDTGEISDDEIAELREDILRHLQALNLPSWASGANPGTLSKDSIRRMHAHQRREILCAEQVALGHKWQHLIQYFANGNEVRPEAIEPELVQVKSDHWTSDLFRFATLLWSVPVSKGYGRRMRYLVRDRANGKLIGIFALGDPVFNLRARDEWIGWNVEQRRSGLVHVMDAHVVGAVPPYSYLLGGKLVASLIGSAEVSETFARRYAEAQGIISKKKKAARLVLVTVTSALGRSSLYNRLKLTSPTKNGDANRTLVELIRVGTTEGYGHFQLSEPLFRRLRQLLVRRNHAYANGHQYGDGPNWRIRLLRVGLAMIGLDPDLLRHGIAREVYVMPMTSNCREFLCGKVDEIHLDRPTMHEIACAAISRWVLPRAYRYPQYSNFDRAELLVQLRSAETTSTSLLP